TSGFGNSTRSPNRRARGVCRDCDFDTVTKSRHTASLALGAPARGGTISRPRRRCELFQVVFASAKERGKEGHLRSAGLCVTSWERKPTLGLRESPCVRHGLC